MKNPWPAGNPRVMDEFRLMMEDLYEKNISRQQEEIEYLKGIAAMFMK